VSHTQSCGLDQLFAEAGRPSNVLQHALVDLLTPNLGPVTVLRTACICGCCQCLRRPAQPPGNAGRSSGGIPARTDAAAVQLHHVPGCCCCEAHGGSSREVQRQLIHVP
jgi:hypothetical protein